MSNETPEWERVGQILECIESGDIAALNLYSQRDASFPRGSDARLGRLWIDNAISQGSLAAVRWFLEAGVPVNYCSDEGCTALHSAIEREDNQRWEVMKLLVRGGADLNGIGYAQMTPLHLAVARGDAQAVRILISAGANIGIKDEDGLTPLQSAVQGCASSEIIQCLRDAASRKGG